MGTLTWTKSYSASDNGTVLGGADIQNIQADITTVVNGGITNTNINASAAIVESKIAFNITTGHDHDGTDSKLISATNTHYLKGCELVYDTAATFHANPGVLELNGTILSRTAVSTTLNLATAGHWVSGSEGASAWYYVYAYNDTGTSWDVKLSDEAPAYYDCDVDDASGILRYRDYSSVWYRCIGAIRNDASSNILKFYQYDNKIFYAAYQAIVTNGGETTYTSTALTAAIPVVSSDAMLMIGIENASVGGKYIKLSIDGTNEYYGWTDVLTSSIKPYQSRQVIMPCPSQTIYYLVEDGNVDIYIAVMGYLVGDLR